MGDIEEKTRRLDKLKTDFKTANYDQKLSENTDKKVVAENKRDKLNQEFIMLNREAEARANLNLKRKEIISKNAEIDDTSDLFLYSHLFPSHDLPQCFQNRDQIPETCRQNSDGRLDCN